MRDRVAPAEAAARSGEEYLTPLVVGRRIDHLVPSRRHWHLWIVVGGAIFVDFYDLTMGGAIAGFLLHSHWSTLMLNSTFFSVGGLGAVIGTFTAGFLADRIGRIRTLQLFLLVIVLGTLLCALSVSMPWLIASRLLAAVGMGSVPAVGFTYLAEMTPPKVRARWACSAAVIINCSGVAASLTAYYLLPMGAWRWMFALPAVAGIALAWRAQFIAESPRWLAVAGRMAESQAALAWLEAGSAARHGPAGSVEDPAPIEAVIELPASIGEGARALFRRPLAKSLILGSCIAIAANVTSNGLIAWLPTLLWSGDSMSRGLGQSFLVMLGAPLGAVVGFFLADRFGRMRGLIGAALAASALAVGCAFSAGTTAVVPLAFLLTVGMSLVCTIVLGVYIPEIFPTSLRARGSSLALTASRVGMTVAPFAIAALLRDRGMMGVMLFFGACLASIGLVVHRMGIETARRGLSDV
jgi:MFS transporter, putative metabolite:H+ symporter